MERELTEEVKKKKKKEGSDILAMLKDIIFLLKKKKKNILKGKMEGMQATGRWWYKWEDDIKKLSNSCLSESTAKTRGREC